MSGQKTATLPVLTDKQRAWANAFLKAMGGKGAVEATAKPQEQRPRRGNTPVPPELAGGLGGLETSVQGGVQQARDKLAGEDEDISRKKRIGKSVDKGFKQNVADPVDKILEAVDGILARGGAVNEIILPAVTDLREKLVTSRTGYQQSNQREKDRGKREQRQRKIDAVTTRLDALDELIKASGGMQKDRTDALAELDAAGKAKLLAANPEICKAVIAAKPPAAELADLITNAPADAVDAFIEEAIKAHSGDSAYMEVLCERCLGAELSKAEKDPATFMRGNTVGSKLTKAYAASGDGGAFLNDVCDNTKVWLGSVNSSRPIEIDPVKEEDGRKREEGVGRLLHYVNALLGSLMKGEVPRPIATTAGMIATGARKQGRNDSDVAIMVGGHVFLRLINPALVVIPTTSPEQKRALILATKVLQNASNGILGTPKEPFMDAFSDMIADELPALQDWFLDIAKQGDAMRGQPPGEDDRESWIAELQSEDFDRDANFLPPSEEDPMGLQPSDPRGALGQLILADLAAHAPRSDVRLPPQVTDGFLKVVARARAEVLARVTEQLEDGRPLVPEDAQDLSNLIDAFEQADVDDGTLFAAPSEADPLGVQPVAPRSPAGRLILADVRANPNTKGIMLPPTVMQGHLKLVTRARTDAVGRIVGKLKAAQ